MSTPKSYANLVSQAEAAVSAVKDAELRRVAFEKILDDLLLTASHASIHPAAADARSTTRTIHTQKQETPSRPPAKRTGPQAYVEELVEEGFFSKQKTISEVKVELENRGHHIPLTSLSGPMQKLCQKKSLRRQKMDGKGNTKSFGYSNW